MSRYSHSIPVKQQLFYRLRRLLLFVALLLFYLPSHAQLVLHSAYMLGTYNDRVSITLDSGFISEPSFGQQLVLTVDSAVIAPVAVKPNNSVSYVVAYSPRVPGIANPADTTLTNAQVSVGIQYTDGLGRPIQTIQVKGSPMGYDVIQPTAYDSTGRQSKQYLPYTINDNNAGAYRYAGLVEQSDYYKPATATASNIATTNYPFAQTRYEASPFNRVLEQGAPGADWQIGAHTQGIFYTTNDTIQSSGGHALRKYSVEQSDGSLSRFGVYDAGSLSVTITHDENWTSSDSHLGTVETYTDMAGHIVLKRTYNYNTATSSTEKLSTYYVYDDVGNLTYILPPSADPDKTTGGPPSDATINTFCYHYRYDKQNRLISKKIPGKGISYILYNQLDRPVIAQDSVLRGNTKWTAVKYDGLGRIIMTGVWDAGSSPALTTLQDSINKHAAYDKRDTSNTTLGYAITSYPAISHPLTISYYDDYYIPNLPAAYDLHTDTTYSNRTQGRLTATRTAILKADGSISTDMLWTVYYYDNKGRNIKTFKQHYLGGVQSVYNYDVVTASYDFTGAPTQAVRNHYAKNSGNTAAVLGVAIKDSIIYDHMERPLQTWNRINNGTKVLLNKADYNELGQAVANHVHSTNGTAFLQDISYKFNERGWLTKASAPLFAEQLKYNDGTTPQYNGNIANQLWGKANSLTNTFTYAYDKNNRLTSGSSANMSETGISYDLMGNIQSLTRDGHAISYAYDSSKQLTSVSGTGVQSGTYSYDGNGNVVNDGSNGFSFTNNMYNLPRQATDGTQTISYTYDAAGNKLSKSNTVSGLTEYVGGIQYGSNTGSYGIDFIPVAGGRAERKTDGSYRYEYGLTDHLGNVRAVIQENPITHVADTLQRDDYYPFGSRRSLLAGDNKYLYNGKEMQDEFNQYDYGARFYNPAIGRWNGVDQMAERYNSLSPYNYVMNNPIMFTDPDGRDPDCPDCKANSHTSNGESYDSSNGYTYIYQTSSKTWRRDPSMPKREPKELNEVTIKGEKYDPYNPYLTPLLDGGNDDDRAPQIPSDSQGSELDKYGQIVAAYNLSAGASGGAVGLNTEKGIVFTNKGWARKYITVYYAPGLAAPSGTIGMTAVFALPGQHPTFSDWHGAMLGVAGSYDFISGNAGLTSTYAVFGLGLSYTPYNAKASSSLNFGITHWDGSPYQVGNLNVPGATEIYQNTMKFNGGN